MTYLTSNFLSRVRKQITEYVNMYGQEDALGHSLDISDMCLLWLSCPGMSHGRHVRIMKLRTSGDDLIAEVEENISNASTSVKYEDNSLQWASIYDGLVEVYGDILEDDERIVLSPRPMRESEIRLTARELTLLALKNKSIAKIVLLSAGEILAAEKEANPFDFDSELKYLNKWTT